MRHLASLKDAECLVDNDLGSLSVLNADSFPILDGLSIKRLTLAPGSIREPHWHANATELTYCLSGKLLVGMLDDGSTFDSFLLDPGQMFTARSGALHHIENVGDEVAELIVTFRHERPQDFSLRTSMDVMSNAVLGNTYDLPASAFEPMRTAEASPYILRRQGDCVIPEGAADGSPSTFDVEAQDPLIDTPGGNARLARRDFWPALEDISMYSLRIGTEGMREPHWHPETAEMGYVHQGHARMTVLDPEGHSDTYELNPGDAYFIPRAFPHHIEDVGNGDLHLLIFFDQAMPQDIGYRASASAFSKEVMAATMGLPPEELPDLPYTPVDPLIVKRHNPVD